MPGIPGKRAARLGSGSARSAARHNNSSTSIGWENAPIETALRPKVNKVRGSTLPTTSMTDLCFGPVHSILLLQPNRVNPALRFWSAACLLLLRSVPHPQQVSVLDPVLWAAACTPDTQHLVVHRPPALQASGHRIDEPGYQIHQCFMGPAESFVESWPGRFERPQATRCIEG